MLLSLVTAGMVVALVATYGRPQRELASALHRLEAAVSVPIESIEVSGHRNSGVTGRLRIAGARPAGDAAPEWCNDFLFALRDLGVEGQVGDRCETSGKLPNLWRQPYANARWIDDRSYVLTVGY